MYWASTTAAGIILVIIGALVIFFANISHVGAVFTAIFKGAFGLRAVGGGIVGSGVKLAPTWGMKRGVFSNEAGLGSSVMVHSSSNVKEPVRQGMWGIFEVFADTMVVCTLTAFAVLSSGLIDLDTGAVLVDVSGSAFIAIAILLFAFSTVLGWSHYGSKACEYLFSTKSTMVYKVVFVLMIFIGCTMNLGLAWDLSDTFNSAVAIATPVAPSFGMPNSPKIKVAFRIIFSTNANIFNTILMVTLPTLRRMARYTSVMPQHR